MCLPRTDKEIIEENTDQLLRIEAKFGLRPSDVNDVAKLLNVFGMQFANGNPKLLAVVIVEAAGQILRDFPREESYDLESLMWLVKGMPAKTNDELRDLEIATVTEHDQAYDAAQASG
jgi:hypothetical protein